MTVSLHITTYNRPDALEMVLRSVLRQTVKPDEVIVGDDGSTDETAQLIDRYRSSMPMPLIHIWQEDKGFRPAKIRNKCVAASTADYIIEIDGDMLLHPRFVEDHLRFSRKGVFLLGNRAWMSPEYTARFLKDGKWKLPRLLSDDIDKRRMNAVRMPWLTNLLTRRDSNRSHGVMSCNLSFFRSDFLAVNGYDEYFEGWGGEDYDIGLRFDNYGLRCHYLKFSAIAYHMWHNQADKSKSDQNHKYALERYDQKIYWCEKGVDRYLNNDDDTLTL